MFLSQEQVELLHEVVAALEQKERRVRTPAGQRRFKQPIGAIIVDKPDLPDVVPNTPQVVAAQSTQSYPGIDIRESDYEEWEIATYNGIDYYVGDNEDEWIVTEGDDWDAEVGRYPTRDAAIRAIYEVGARPTGDGKVRKKYRVPKTFYDDHVYRSDFWDANEPTSSGNYYNVELTQEEYEDLLSDADYYADEGSTRDFDPEYRGIIRSAAATLRILKESGPPEPKPEQQAPTQEEAQDWPIGHNTSISAHVGDGKYRAFEGKIVAEDETHISIKLNHNLGKNGPKAGTVIKISKSRVKSRQDTAPKKRNTRSEADRDADRASLLEQIGDEWVRAPDGTNRSDIDYLVRSGLLESEVREEFDKQDNSWMFGGAGVVKRRRQYLRKKPQESSQAPNGTWSEWMGDFATEAAARRYLTMNFTGPKVQDRDSWANPEVRQTSSGSWQARVLQLPFTSQMDLDRNSDLVAKSDDELLAIWKEANRDEKYWSTIADSQRESASARSNARREAILARERRDAADAEMIRRSEKNNSNNATTSVQELDIDMPDVVGTIDLVPKSEPVTSLQANNLIQGIEPTRDDVGSMAWEDLLFIDEPADPGLEMAASMMLGRLEGDQLGKYFTTRKEIAEYMDSLFKEIGYGDRIVSITDNEDYLPNPDIEAAVSRGMTELLPEDDPMYKKPVPVFMYRKRGISEAVLLHEIAHIIEGSWLDTSKGHNGHTWNWWETWGQLMKLKGLTVSVNFAQVLGGSMEGKGVFK